jgi:hypothetical protein
LTNKPFIYNLRYFYLILFCFPITLLAQEKKIGETKYYYYANNPSDLIHVDTGLNNIEHHNFIYQDGWEYRNLGNLGTANRPLFYKWDDKKGFKSGMNQFDLYKFSIEKIKYFQIEKPISEIYYTMGSNKEHIFKGSIAQNIKNRFLLGIDFHRLASEGVFQRQKTRNAGFASYGKYTSGKGNYNFDYQIAFWQVKVQENGGLRDDILDPEFNLPFNLQLLPTNLNNNVITQHQNTDILISNTYNIGFHQADSISDSLAVRKFYPILAFQHTTGYQNNKFNYLDKNPVASFYNSFLQEDSVFYGMQYRSIPNKISVKYLGAQEKDSVTYFKLSGEAGLQHDFISLTESIYRFNFHNMHFFASLGTNPLNTSKLKFSANTYYYFAGYNQNDLHASGNISYNFDKWGEVSGKLLFENAEASWIENYFLSPTLFWLSNFKKKQNLEFSGQYHLKNQKLKLAAQYNLLGGHIFFNELSLPVQLNETISYWNFSAQKDLQWRTLHFDNFIGLQGVSNTTAIRVPRLFVKSSFYIEGKIFKGNMLGRVGIDMRYNTNFMLESWNPLIGQFHIQNEQNSKFVPVFDFFVSFKVQTLRVFAKSNYISQGLLGRNYYHFTNHPDRGRTFAGGLIWRFLE